MAAPNPILELKRLKKLVGAGLPSIVLLHGPSEYFRSKAMSGVLLQVAEDAELRTVDGAEVRAGDDEESHSAAAVPVLQDLRGGGLFAAATVVAVRRGANWWKKHSAAVAEVASMIQAGSSLIVEAPKLDKRKRAVAALVKQLAAEGCVFEFRDLYDMPYERSRGPLEGELCQWLVQTSKQLGVELTPESAWLMMSSFFLEYRSASGPTKGANRNAGMRTAALKSENWVTEPVSRRITTPRQKPVSCVPTSDKSWPLRTVKNRLGSPSNLLSLI